MKEALNRAEATARQQATQLTAAAESARADAANELAAGPPPPACSTVHHFLISSAQAPLRTGALH